MPSFVARFAGPRMRGMILTASRLMPALLAALRRAVRGLRQIHEEQLLMWELRWQADRATPPDSGPLVWVLTLDGRRLAGSHLPSQTTPAPPCGGKNDR
jgi:hypothetical protein